jgi:arginine decarboxylase
VGGGLGVDYEGSRSQHYCSINYDLVTYAAEVLRPISRICQQRGLPEPMIFSESGRAMTAHHAVLITDVIEREAPFASDCMAHYEDELLQRFRALLDDDAGGNAPQRMSTAQALLAEAQERFAQGDLGLAERAQAENLFVAVARSVRDALRLGSRRHRELLETLNDVLAERVFCNFSLFQSLPDIWAIDQIFPVMPLQRLHEVPDRAVVLHDLTCDSDGCIDNYVDQDGVETTLMLHDSQPGEPYLLGIFLVGAYQEILGDMHNLFGDTDAVSVDIDADGGYRLGPPEPGDAVDELLRYVHFDPDAMLEVYRRRLRENRIDDDRAEACFHELERGLCAYTYLSND